MQKKQIIELGITSCLILVLLFAVVNGIKSTKRTRRRLREEAKKAVALEKKEALPDRGGLERKVSAQAPRGLAGKTLFEKLNEETKGIKPKRDPFTLIPTISTKASSALHLAGILWDEENPRALINDTIVEIGDDIDGNIVVDIKQDKVILNDGSDDFELRLY